MKKLVLLLCLSPYAFGQNQTSKTPIHFICSCDDSIGARYATAFRDLIASSPRYIEANKAEEYGPDGKTIAKYNWVIDVVSIDTDAPVATGNESALAVVIKVGNTFYWTHWIQICGSAKAAYCASTTLADFDAEVQKIK